MKKILNKTLPLDIIEQGNAESRENTDVSVELGKKTENDFLDRLVSVLERLSKTPFGKFFGAGKYQGDLSRNLKQDIF